MAAKYPGEEFKRRFGPWAVIAGGSDGIGRASFRVTMPGGTPRGVNAYLQAWVADSQAKVGFSASNALQLRVH